MNQKLNNIVDSLDLAIQDAKIVGRVDLVRRLTYSQRDIVLIYEMMYDLGSDDGDDLR